LINFSPLIGLIGQSIKHQPSTIIIIIIIIIIITLYSNEVVAVTPHYNEFNIRGEKISKM